MSDAVVYIRFAHYLEDFVDDEGFLQATHQAGLQVEKKKALKLAREHAKAPTGMTENTTKGKRTARTKIVRTTPEREKRPKGNPATKATKTAGTNTEEWDVGLLRPPPSKEFPSVRKGNTQTLEDVTVVDERDIKQPSVSPVPR